MLRFADKRIMVVVAHPDDELLGLGATMHKLITKQQVTARVVILGEGITSRAEQRDTKLWERELEIHRSNIRYAQQAIGYHSVNTYDFPDNRFDTVALLDLVKVIEKEKEAFRPDIIFTHHGGDLNIDHQRTFQAVITATRPMENEGVKTVITFETPSGTEWQASNDPRHFAPNLFIEVSEEDLMAKIKGMEAYQFERRDYPHPRSAEALRTIARQRGVTVGKEFAEAFQLIRCID